MKTIHFLAGLLCLTLISCTPKKDAGRTLSGLSPADFRTEIDGKPAGLYTLKNKAGMEVCLTNFGGRIVSVMVPDRTGKMQDVVLGFDRIEDYIHCPSDFGAAIGRYANRINQGRFEIDGKTIQLPRNNFGHCLHGGPKGWQYQVYTAEPVGDSVLRLTLLSPDGDQGFPGNVRAEVTYTLTEDNSIDIEYRATTDRNTIINMTNHSYFNLSGDPSKSIQDHILYINADRFTPVDSTFMTTGEILPVKGTPMDFTVPKAVGKEIDDTSFVQLKNGRGYDHNWVLNAEAAPDRPAASLFCPATGIRLDVYTGEPGIQVYTGNFLDGSVTGKHKVQYGRNAAICLETQHYPDSPNKPDWPSVLLEPGKVYTSVCRFRFSVSEDPS